MSTPRRSILSQILSGLACVVLAATVLIVMITSIQMTSPSRCFPRELMPPREVSFLRNIALGVSSYAMDHDFHYPAELKEIPIDYFFSKPGEAELEFLASSNLKYFPPPDRVPGVSEDRTALLLAYETDTWAASITAGGDLKYHRKNRNLPARNSAETSTGL